MNKKYRLLWLILILIFIVLFFIFIPANNPFAFFIKENTNDDSSQSLDSNEIYHAIEKEPMTATIIADGNITDWAELNPIITGNGNLKNLYAVFDQSKLHILITGVKIGEKYTLFIDSDNNNETGYSDDDVHGIDYCLDENGDLFRFLANSDILRWENVGQEQIYRSDTIIEATIDLIDMACTKPTGMHMLFRDWGNLESLPLLKKGMAFSDILITGVEDNIAPTVPQNLHVFAKTLNTITLKWFDSSDNLSVKGYNIYRDGRKVGHSPHAVFTDSGLAEGTSYKYTVDAFDSAGNVSISSSMIVVTTNTCKNEGTITTEVWKNFNGALDEIRSDSCRIDPDILDQLTSFETPVKLSDNYGTRIRGYICPSISGEYEFYISSDDSSELWLSVDERPVNKKLIAYVTGYTEYREWSKYRSQKSNKLSLEAGKKYYIEAVHVEGYLGDHMSAGWKKPNSNSIEIISGKYLFPYWKE